MSKENASANGGGFKRPRVTGFALTAAASLVLAGCLNTNSALRRETARIVGDGVPPASIELHRVRRGMETVDWTADTPKGPYTCTSDDRLWRPLCVPIAQADAAPRR